MGVLINVVLPVFLVAGAAALAQTRLKLDSRSLSRAAFYLFSPAVVLNALANSDVSSAEYGRIVASLFLTVAVLWAFGEVMARLLNLNGTTRAAFLVAIILMNSGNYGMSVNYFAFGDPGLARASLCVTVNNIITATVGVYIMARGQAEVGHTAQKRPASRHPVLRRVFSVPAIYAVALGLMLNLTGLTLPEPLLKAVDVLGRGLVPVSLTVLGIQLVQTLRERHELAHVPALLVVIVGRLLIAPAVARLAGGWMGLDGLTRDVVTLEMATPTAIMSLVLANEFKSNVSFSALCILVTTFASLVSVTLWLSGLL